MIRATTWLLQQGLWYAVEPTEAGVGWTLCLHRADDVQRRLLEHLGVVKKVGRRQWQVIISRQVVGSVGVVHNVEASNANQAITKALEDQSTVVGLTSDEIAIDDADINWAEPNENAMCYDVDNNNDEIEMVHDEHGFWKRADAQAST